MEREPRRDMEPRELRIGKSFAVDTPSNCVCLYVGPDSVKFLIWRYWLVESDKIMEIYAGTNGAMIPDVDTESGTIMAKYLSTGLYYDPYNVLFSTNTVEDIKAAFKTAHNVLVLSQLLELVDLEEQAQEILDEASKSLTNIEAITALVDSEFAFEHQNIMPRIGTYAMKLLEENDPSWYDEQLANYYVPETLGEAFVMAILCTKATEETSRSSRRRIWEGLNQLLPFAVKEMIARVYLDREYNRSDHYELDFDDFDDFDYRLLVDCPVILHIIYEKIPPSAKLQRGKLARAKYVVNKRIGVRVKEKDKAEKKVLFFFKKNTFVPLVSCQHDLGHQPPHSSDSRHIVPEQTPSGNFWWSSHFQKAMSF
ncbi:hypothetical protein ACHAPU_008548 [Fusarium lateritium]